MNKQSPRVHNSPVKLSRRDWVRCLFGAGTAMAAGSLVAACQQPSPPPATSQAKPPAPSVAPAAASTAKPPEPTTAPQAAKPPEPTTAPQAAKPPEPTKAPAVAAASPATSIKRGGEIVVAMPTDVTTFDPLTSNSNPNKDPFLHVYGRLLLLDAQSKLTPWQIESWEETPDHLNWILHIRKGQKFHDGTDFDANAIKVNFERFMDPKFNSPRAAELTYVTGFTVVDPSTLKIQLSQPNASLLYNFMDHAGDILSPTAIQKFGDDIARQPVGAGPFKFKEWVKNDRVVLIRSDGFWNKDLPYVNTLTYKPVTDAGARLAGIRSGAIHATRGLAARDLTALKNDPNFQVIIRPSTSDNALRFNLAVPPFDKKEIRQAICWAIDTASIEKAIFFDAGIPANQLMSPEMIGYDPDLTMYRKPDLEKAKSLLAAGGQPNGFKSQLLANASNADDVKIAQAIKSQLEKIGVVFELETLEQATLVSRLNSNQFPSILITHAAKVDPFFSLSRFFWSKSTLNNYAYKSAEFDSLLDKSAATGDPVARAAVYRQMARLLAEDAVWAYIRYPETTEILRKEIKGYVYNPDGLLHLYNAWVD